MSIVTSHEHGALTKMKEISESVTIHCDGNGRMEHRETRRFGDVARHIFQLLEADDLVDRVSRIELYGRTQEGIVPCVVYVTPGIQSGDHPEAEEALLLSIHSVLHGVKSMLYPLRWRFISAFDGDEPDQDGQRYLLGDNPQLLATGVNPRLPATTAR